MVTAPKNNVLTTSDLGFRGNVSRVAWELPSDLPETEWREAGTILGRVEHSVSWWLGDWWAFGENRYGDRKAIVEADDWDGPAYQTCRNAASIASAFELSRRRDNLSFNHHAEVVGRPPKEADRLLDWAEKTISETGKPRTIAALRAEVRASVRAEKKADYFQRVEAAKWRPLEGTYRVLYIDRPWKYHGLNQADEYGHAEAHYECLDDDQLIWFRPEQPKTEYHRKARAVSSKIGLTRMPLCFCGLQLRYRCQVDGSRSLLRGASKVKRSLSGTKTPMSWGFTTPSAMNIY